MLAEPTLQRGSLQTHSYWWTWAVSGLVTIGVGVLCLFKPGQSLKALAVIAGLYFLLDSVMAFASTFGHDVDNRGLAVLHGIVSLVIGLLLVRHPLESITAIALLIGIWLLAIGSVRFVAAFHAPDHVVTRALIALVPFVGGVIVLASPHIGYGALALVIGIALVAQGVGMIALGWSLRHA